MQAQVEEELISEEIVYSLEGMTFERILRKQVSEGENVAGSAIVISAGALLEGAIGTKNAMWKDLEA